MLGKHILILFLTLLYSFLPPSSYAQETDYSAPTPEEQFEAVVIEIVQEREIDTQGTKHLYQKLRLRGTSGSLKDEEIVVESGELPAVNIPEYHVDEKVVVSRIENPDGTEKYFILDYVRRGPLYALVALFVLTALIVARKKGITSLFGLVFSFLVIFKFVLPQILAGNNPVMIALVGAAIIVPVTFYLTHGINTKTHVAIAGTIIALALTGVLSFTFVQAARLTGFSTEEAGFLQVAIGGTVNIKGLLLAGIIIGLLGILDDITITQAAIVQKLKETTPALSSKALYSKAMDVGRDHIASVVNTLILVYTGAALPFLLLFITSSQTFSSALNFEIIAEEIIRTLTASIGLMLAVPITTFLAAVKYK